MEPVLDDRLALQALDGLLRAEAAVRRRLSFDLEREGLSATGFTVLVLLRDAGGEGLSATGFTVLVLLRDAGGELELRALRARLGTAKASATEVVGTLEGRGLAVRERLASDRRAVSVRATATGAELVDRLFPEHAERVAATFAALDEREKRTLAALCEKLAA